MLGKVDLSPAFDAALLSDAFPRCRTDVLYHASMFGLVDALSLVHILSTGVSSDMRITLAAFALCLFVSQLAIGQATPTEITH